MTTTKTFEDIKPRALKIRHHGSISMEMNPMGTFWQFTFARGRQIVEQIQEELSIVGGDYTWVLRDARGFERIEGGHYELVARWNGMEWVDGAGKTPKAALMNCWAFRAVAERMGWTA